jgi:hypothetical protein
MITYTAHTKPGRQPILVKEGFSWGAFLFGPLWFAAQLAWVPAAIQLVLIVVLLRLLPLGGLVVLFGIALLAGLLGRDLVRWTLERRGYTLVHVLAARNEEAALGRLLTFRPDLAAQMMALLQ